jgi:hypothetical protein
MTERDLPGMAGNNVEAVRQHGIDDNDDKNGDEISADHENFEDIRKIRVSGRSKNLCFDILVFR